MKIDVLYPGKYLKCEDLAGKSVSLRVAKVERVPVKMRDGTTEKKVVLSFDGTERQLLSCVTNGLMIAILLGRDTDHWIGRRVTLRPAMVRAFGKKTPCIRVAGSPDADKERADRFADATRDADRRDGKDLAASLWDVLNELEPRAGLEAAEDTAREPGEEG